MLPSNRSTNRRYFDENSIPDDVWQVLRTASILNISEFRVFEIAYHRWFGNYATEEAIECYFVPYMFEDHVPMWVRAFCSHVMNEYECGTLELRHYGITPPVSTWEQQLRGLEYLIWIIVALVVLFLFTDAASELLPNKCLFPPCY